MRVTVVTMAVAAAATIWVGLSAQQEMLPKPGPGSGITKVVGDVNIGNTPDVRVTELPPVRVTEMPTVSIANPPFLRKGERYLLTWNDGSTEAVVVFDVGHDGWVQVEGQRLRWINLRLARSVEAGR